MSAFTFPNGYVDAASLRSIPAGPLRLLETAATLDALLHAADMEEFPSATEPRTMADRLRRHERNMADPAGVEAALAVRCRLSPGSPDGDLPGENEVREATTILEEAIAEILEETAVAEPSQSSKAEQGRILAFANQKGGVGKTTTTINLAASLALAGRRVLVIDMDPQGNASSGFGIDKNNLERSIYDCLVDGEAPAAAILPTLVESLFILPANRELVGAEVELVDGTNREGRLAATLAKLPANYDYIFIDSPPSLSLLTVNALTAAQGVVITLQCEFYALEGLSELLQTIKLVRDNLNQGLRLEGVLLTMYQHTRLSQQVMEDVRGHLSARVYETVIPRNVNLSEAPSFGQPAVCYDPRSAGAQAYFALAEEMLSNG